MSHHRVRVFGALEKLDVWRVFSACREAGAVPEAIIRVRRGWFVVLTQSSAQLLVRVRGPVVAWAVDPALLGRSQQVLDRQVKAVVADPEARRKDRVFRTEKSEATVS